MQRHRYSPPTACYSLRPCTQDQEFPRQYYSFLPYTYSGLSYGVHAAPPPPRSFFVLRSFVSAHVTPRCSMLIGHLPNLNQLSSMRAWMHSPAPPSPPPTLCQRAHQTFGWTSLETGPDSLSSQAQKVTFRRQGFVSVAHLVGHGAKRLRAAQHMARTEGAIANNGGVGLVEKVLVHLSNLDWP